MKNRVYYFAYGLAMYPRFMKKTCPHAKPVCAATLKNYRLAERLYADIDPDPASEVYGVLFAITPGDKKRLDRHADSLNAFTGIEVEVEFGDVKYKAFTYMMTPEGKRKHDGTPYKREYLRQCRSGASYYMVPNSFRFANFIAYGTNMTGEKDETFSSKAVIVRPCTLTGTLYDSGYHYPLFSPKGNTVVEAEYLRIPQELLDDTMEMLDSSPFKPEFLVAKAPDGSTFGGWAVCLDVMPPRAKVIESGCWKDWHKLKYDYLEFAMTSDECNAQLKINFPEGTLSCELFKTMPDGKKIKRKGECRIGRFWRKELLAALRECRFERWQTRYCSNGERFPLWFVELNKGEDTVKFIRGMNVYPLNWDMFKNVFWLCLRLCDKEGGASAAAKGKAEGNAAKPKPAENKDRTGIPAGQDVAQVPPPPAAPAGPEKPDTAETKPAPEKRYADRKPGSAPAQARNQKTREAGLELEPELPLFDGDVPYSASGLFKGEKRDDAAAAGPEPDKPAEQDPGAKQDGHDDLCPDPPPPDNNTDRG